MARLYATTLPLRRQADCICSFSFFPFPFPARSPTLVRSPPPAFSLTPSNFLLIVFVASFLPLPPFSFARPLPTFLLSFSTSSNNRAMRPTRARESRARYTTHMAGRPLLLAECAVLPPAGDRVTWPSGRNGTQRATRAVLSREPRTRHQSETNRETGPTDRILSPRKRVCAFSLPFFLRFFLSISPFLSFFPPHSLPVLQLSPLFLPIRPPVLWLRYARDVSCPGTTRVRPRVVSFDVSAATCQSPSVLCCLHTVARAVIRLAANRGIVGAHWNIFVTLTASEGEHPFGRVKSAIHCHVCSSASCRDENGQ